jgi:ATP-dependent Clp protease ATP-binding subunit ClpA
MDRINYPLLYFELKPDLVLGMLVGAEIEAIAENVNSLKGIMLDYLQKQYKKYDEYPLLDIESPRLKMVTVSTRPTYRDKTGSYPLKDTLTLSLPVIYGEVEQGYYECHIPHFKDSFYYYDPRQFDTLVQYSLTTQLNQASPEKIFRLLRQPEPQMDIVSLKVNFDRDYSWGSSLYQRKFEVLGRLAEKYPPRKAVRRNRSALPEAAWGLEDKVSLVIDKLVNTRSNVLLTGHHGTGKSAVLLQAIKKITSKSRKQKLDYTFWRILPQRITASTKYLGEWEEVVEQMIDELSAVNGVLWVENVIQLLQTGGEGPEDSVAAFLMSFMQRGKLQLFGEATPQELESMRRLLPGFAEAFQVIPLEEQREQQVLEVLSKFAVYAAKNLNCPITNDAQQLAYRLLLRYYPYESFPGKGIKFLGQCTQEARQLNRKAVDNNLVIDTFVKQTGLPALFLRDDLLLDTNELDQYFRERIIGQPGVVRKLSETVKIYKAGLNNPYKPISSLIFAGPTGVGKTASAKALAEYFFGKGQKKSPLVRIDMSEFQHPSQIVRLIGAGREPGQLIREIRERPFSVLLLDEIEKANPSIFDALLGVLDEGMMVDAYGRTTNFRNTIIIMTSNLGASNQHSIGFGEDTDQEAIYQSAVERYFRPEFVNRIDGVVIFQSLQENDIRQIALKELKALNGREGIVKRGLQLSFSKGVVEMLTKTGFDERYGARPLQRTIEQQITNPVANWLLSNPQINHQALLLSLDKTGALQIKPGAKPR